MNATVPCIHLVFMNATIPRIHQFVLHISRSFHCNSIVFNDLLKRVAIGPPCEALVTIMKYNDVCHTQHVTAA